MFLTNPTEKQFNMNNQWICQSKEKETAFPYLIKFQCELNLLLSRYQNATYSILVRENYLTNTYILNTHNILYKTLKKQANLQIYKTKIIDFFS